MSQVVAEENAVSTCKQPMLLDIEGHDRWNMLDRQSICGFRWYLPRLKSAVNDNDARPRTMEIISRFSTCQVRCNLMM